MRLEPLFDRVVLRRLTPEEQASSAGGIILPGREPQSDHWLVIAVSDAASVRFKVGDRVLIGMSGGLMTRVDGVEVAVVRETDLVARVHDDEAQTTAVN